jgi:PBP4 family serine-type D-alanyl-D-alanine carboxypeptidase
MRWLLFVLAAPALAALNWNQVLDNQGGVGVHFGAALEGPEPFARNSAELFAPASNSKLFTASAALALLGENFQYKTRLAWEEASEGVATNLRLVGEGDPSWGMIEFGETLRSRVEAIAKALKNAGVKTVQGEVEVAAADPRWDELTIPEGWKSEDPEGCGGALAQGFNLDINCSTLEITSAGTYRWESGATTPVELQIASGSKTRLTAHFARREGGKFGYVVSGTWKKGSAPKKFILPVWGTSGWIRSLFLEALEKEGIRLEARSSRGPKRETKRLEFFSPPLSELIKPFLKNSINFMGDAFLKTLAVHENRPEESLLEGGRAVIRDYLLRLGVPDEFLLNDGCGLSRTSRVTPRALLALLSQVEREPYFPALWNALAVAGVDGTLRNRMKGTVAAGRLRGKTGTLDGVYNLAGYVPGKNGYEPFVVFTKTTVGKSAVARAAEDRVGIELAGLVPKTSLEEPLVPYLYVPGHAGMDDQ